MIDSGLKMGDDDPQRQWISRFLFIEYVHILLHSCFLSYTFMLSLCIIVS